jgi:hypothetical protein
MSSKAKLISWDSPFNCLCIFFLRWRGWWVWRVTKRKKSPGSCYSISHSSRQLTEQLDSFVQIYFRFRQNVMLKAPKLCRLTFVMGKKTAVWDFLFLLFQSIYQPKLTYVSSRMCWVRPRLSPISLRVQWYETVASAPFTLDLIFFANYI